MAFPVVEGTATSASSTNVNPHSIALPAGVVAGDFLLVIHELAAPIALTYPAGWVQFFTQLSNPGTNQQVLAYKKAVGGETSVSVTFAGAAPFAANSYRISGVVNPAVQPPQAVGIGGKADSPPIDGRNPPPLSPTGGSKDYLWITGYASSEPNSTSPPSPYTNQILIASAGGGRCNSARRNLTAATEDPGAWAVGAGRYSTTTIAIHPGLPGGVGTLSGTVTDDTEIDIRAGGSTIILTLLGAAWAAAGATFNAERQAIIDGLVSAQSEATGWNAVLRPAIPVANVVRTSDTVVTITLPAEPAYSIVADETITATIPASATDDVAPILAEPTFIITRQPPPFFPQIEALSQGSGNNSTQIVTLPTPVSAGELLLAFIAMGTSNPANFPSPWVVIGTGGVSAVPGAVFFTVAYLQAVGGETTVTFTGAQQTVWNIYRITGHRDPTQQPPQVVFQTSVRTDITPLDPPLLTPTGGSQEYLWLAGGAAKLFCNQVGSPPANYSALDCVSLSNDMVNFIGRRELIAASENPGAFAVLGAGPGASFTASVPPALPPTAALTGTVIGDTEANIRLGGSTLILTLTGGTWVAAGATFNAQRQNIIDGLDSAQAEPAGWDAQVRPNISVTDVVRTSNTVVTITLPAVPGYDITLPETITATVPNGAMVGFVPDVVASPSFIVSVLLESSGGPAGTQIKLLLL